MSSDLRRQAARLSEAATEENRRGIYLALCSSIFIGASFIIKKKGLILASQKGTRAGAGGYSYLTEPLWWVGMLTMIGGEFANFAAYAYAPAIVVTPLGASTIIISAILANFFLGESLHACGILACVLAVCGSLILLSHAPAEAPLESVEEIWALATQPQFLVYACLVISLSILLMYRFAPRYGRTHLLIYVLICSLVGSLSVVSCKALGIALKLTLRGSNQVFKKETFAFLCCVICCILVQMNYLNKALDTFNTAVVSSTYYVFFTTCTITASMIMYKDWEGQAAGTITVQVAGFMVLMPYSISRRAGPLNA
ncbi:magnesium transporter nipa2-like protein [Chrysochromulina tobinii]|uniref:Magnesium transporter nipa2-like protein n=1 Tax=Chrysochromulina tobinii TaxID=1460289 RepID=A0A0M0J3K2_9EUKA|nr:magnesium transporter nipa2-like protein [Chrysochromulina tobinii]|eukprot:KOO21141.1 magnesium transporter nipa2-like protein [Chrysochromulina sp. CCMP291]